MGLFTADIEDSDFLSAWGTACNLIRGSVAKGVMAGVKEGAQEARDKHTFKNRTGELEKSIVGVALGWSGGGAYYQAVIRADAPYAAYVEYDTKPHEIVIRKADWLHWEEPQGDHHFAKRVHHPGTKGQPFMHLAYYKCERVIVREIELGVEAAQAVLNR